MARRDSSQPFSPTGEARAHAAQLRDLLTRGRGLSAVVVGAGKSGQAAAALLRDRGAEVVVLDDAEGRGDGPITRSAVDGVDLVVLSPGVPRAREALSGAIDAGTLVSEIELASWFVRAPMVGITGTNGKSTTTALVAHLLETAGKRVFAGGNLGRPLSELALEGEVVDVVCVELSSYQLESIVLASFAVSCWLNLQADHADRYPDLETYAAAKRRILERRAVNGIAVLNAKDRWCSDIGIRVGGPTRWFAASDPTGLSARQARLPGSARSARRAPLRGLPDPSDLAGPMGTLAPGEEAVRTVWDEEERYRIGNPALPGAHNRANACAAIECARYFDDVTPEAVQRGLDSFPGLPHRLERIAEIDGVVWFNDSKATNVESAVTAVRAIPGPKILIAGGKDKGASWVPLVEAAEANEVKLVLAVGEAASIVKAAFPDAEEVGTLERAVERAKAIAAPKDSVLLSPACASFDQFRDFEARGDHFRALVKGVS